VDGGIPSDGDNPSDGGNLSDGNDHPDEGNHSDGSNPSDGDNPSDEGNPSDGDSYDDGRRSLLAAAVVKEVPENASPVNLSQTPEDRPPIVDKVIEQAVDSSNEYNTSREFIPRGNVSEVEDFLQNYERYETDAYTGPLFTYKGKTVVVVIIRQE